MNDNIDDKSRDYYGDLKYIFSNVSDWSNEDILHYLRNMINNNYNGDKNQELVSSIEKHQLNLDFSHWHISNFKQNQTLGLIHETEDRLPKDVEDFIIMSLSLYDHFRYSPTN